MLIQMSSCTYQVWRRGSEAIKLNKVGKDHVARMPDPRPHLGPLVRTTEATQESSLLHTSCFLLPLNMDPS